MNKSFKYILVTAILFNLTIAGCGVEQTFVEPPKGTVPYDDNGGESDRNDRYEEGDDRSANGTQQSSKNSSSSNAENDVRVVYKNGTYSASSSYTAPSGSEAVKVTLTVEDGNVKSMSLDLASDNQVSQKYKALFAESINEMVIGKPLSEVSGFKVVNGASLTPMGFNQAVEQIKSQSKA